MKCVFSLLVLIIFSSCSQLQTGRSFLSEMDHDDTPYFDAGSDFPILGGDTGKSWRSEKEQLKRTPASAEDLEERRGQVSLKKELRALEASQGEHNSKLYEKYRTKLGSVSERIYFLKLSQDQRHEYLVSRGLIENEQRGVLTPYERMHSQRQSIILGMSKEEVKGNLGKPVRVEIAGNPNYENERWVYSYNGATKYIYFESGKVEGWE